MFNYGLSFIKCSTLILIWLSLIVNCDDTSQHVSIDKEHVKGCPEGWFSCLNGNCIIKRWLCDGQNDCGDQSDETHCSPESTKASQNCSSDKYLCQDGTRCISMAAVCNGFTDCLDGSDENPNCEIKPEECIGFKCGDRTCLPERWHCDGNIDCEDGSDELDCAKLKKAVDAACTHDSQGQFERFRCNDGSRCLNSNFVCDGVRHCVDGSDESENCSVKCPQHMHCTHLCRSTPSGPRCFCRHGFRLALDNNTCTDIDECQEEEICSQICNNTRSSFQCSCYRGYDLQADKRTCSVSDVEPLLIYVATTAIKAITIRSKKVHSINRNLNRGVGVDYDVVENRLYWTDISTNVETISSSKLDATDRRDLITTGLLVPEDIAVDWVARNFYFTDSGLRHIVVCSNDAVFCRVVFDEISNPRAIVVDPPFGFMYWTDWASTPAIEVAGMDGSKRRKFLSDDLVWPNGLALDYTHYFSKPLKRRLFWSDAGLDRIESIRLDGTGRTVLIQDSVSHPFALAVFEDTLFWTDWTHYSVESCNKYTGKNRTLLAKESHKYLPMSLHVYHHLTQPHVNNPCWSNSCSHMCVLAPGGKFSCLCPHGMTLAVDMKSCRDTDSSYLVLTSTHGLHKLEMAFIGRDILRTVKDWDSNRVIIAALYDYTLNAVFLSDALRKQISMVYLNNMTEIVLVDTHLDNADGLAYDWLARNLYWTDSAKRTIEVLHIRSFSSGATKTNPRAILIEHGIGRPLGIAVSPPLGLLFFGNVLHDEAKIDRCNADGSEHHTIAQGNIKSPVTLAIDGDKLRLYWADSTTGSIESTNLNGQDRKLIRQIAGRPVSLAIDSKAIYWADDVTKSVIWIEKNDKLQQNSFSMPANISAGAGDYMRMVVAGGRPPKGTNGCERNSECSHFCFPLHSRSHEIYSCGCPSNMVLEPNGHTCTTEAVCNSNQYTCKDGSCIPVSWMCDGRVDCLDGSDEGSNCRVLDSKCPVYQFSCDEGRERKCISAMAVCDGIDDCADGADERHCNMNCSESEFRCNDGMCIHHVWECDGNDDCPDGRDEMDCPNKKCKQGEFRCDSGQCILASWRCDGEPECRDHSDEPADCEEEELVCLSNEFQCVSDGVCINEFAQCDGDNDCADKSDEVGCPPLHKGKVVSSGSTKGEEDFMRVLFGEGPTSCPIDKFLCKFSRKCVFKRLVCDGNVDCELGEDEDLENCEPNLNGRCGPDEFFCTTDKFCVPQAWVCDGEFDCFDKSDEKESLCGWKHSTKESVVKTELPTDNSPSRNNSATNVNMAMLCSEGDFKCNSEHCILLNTVCDRHFDCPDHSDEGGLCGEACLNYNGGCFHNCMPSPKGPVCACRKGYTLAADEKSCYDINECEHHDACSQGCTNLDGSYVCFCADGYQLTSDHYTCKAAGSAAKLIIAFAQKIVAINVDGHHLDIITHSETGNIRDVAYNYRQQEFYFTDSSLGLIKKHTFGRKQDRTIVQDLVSPHHLAIDWIANTLYYWAVTGNIVVCSLSGARYCSDIVKTDHRNIGFLVLDPTIGLMFWTTWTKSGNHYDGKIERAWMDGQNRHAILSTKLMQPDGLTVDLSSKRLYWFDATLHKLESCDYDGNKRKIITKEGLNQPVALAVFENNIYWADGGTRSIRSCKLPDCRFPHKVLLQNVAQTYAMTVYHSVLQPSGENHCATKRAPCSHICVLVPDGYSCLCPTGWSFRDALNTFCVNENNTFVHNSHTDKRLMVDQSHDNHCPSTYCENGGTCYIDKDKGVYRCNCSILYHGPTCMYRKAFVEAHSERGLSVHEDSSWHSGGIIILIFIIVVIICAIIWYQRNKPKGMNKYDSRSTITPFINPVYGISTVIESRHARDSGHSSPNSLMSGHSSPSMNTYRSYSNPIFEADDCDDRIDISPMYDDEKVLFHVSSSISLDSAINTEDNICLVHKSNQLMD